jgi:CRP-like cAMP-binding protein
LRSIRGSIGNESVLVEIADYQRNRSTLLSVVCATDKWSETGIRALKGTFRWEKTPMSKPQIDKVSHKNQLLGAFEPAARARIQAHLQPVILQLGAVVCEAGGLLQHVYFPEGAVLSLLTVLENGSAIECANIGREGAFGVFAAMYSRVSFNQCVVQLQGPMTRCPIEPLRSEFQQSEHIQNLFVSYSETLLSQVMQSVACNALHSVERRICRWLLTMHDRAEGELLTYTHEFLAHMLGANRTSITLAAQSLQNAGLISYRRGLIQVRDRAGLEKASCECHAVVKARFDAFLSPPPTAVQEAKSGRTQTD